VDGAGGAAEELSRIVNVAYAHRRGCGKKAAAQRHSSYPISSDDATDLKHRLINHVTRRWINALCVADEFADRAASV